MSRRPGTTARVSPAPASGGRHQPGPRGPHSPERVLATLVPRLNSPGPRAGPRPWPGTGRVPAPPDRRQQPLGGESWPLLAPSAPAALAGGPLPRLSPSRGPPASQCWLPCPAGRGAVWSQATPRPPCAQQRPQPLGGVTGITCSSGPGRGDPTLPGSWALGGPPCGDPADLMPGGASPWPGLTLLSPSPTTTACACTLVSCVCPGHV